MNAYFKFGSLIATSFIFACSQRDVSVEKNNEVDKAKEYFTIDFESNLLKSDRGDLIDTVIYLQLATAKGHEISNIDQLEITTNNYIILDKDANEIFFYNKKGEFVRKISPNNKDIPIPFKAIERFNVNKETSIISFNDVHSDRLYLFDLNAKFVQVRTKKNSDYNSDFQYIGNKEIILDYFDADSKYANDAYLPTITISNNNTKKTHGYIYYNPQIIDYKDVIGLSKYFYDSNMDYLLISRPYDYTIYRYDSVNALSKYFTLNFPADKSLPSDFVTSKSYTGKRMRYLKQNNSVIFNISNIYEIGNWVSLKTNSSRQLITYLYNKNQHKLVDLSKVISTKKSNLLPVFSGEILGTDGQYFYSSLTAASVIRYITQGIGKEGYWDSLPISLKTIFNAGNNQNDILLITKMKDI
ncbi:6-bladed beta-propeller [Sphingobacterium multivorum]|uniref:6-bladed beta-propeller n=1 Tax=Sphingobacterium multivorum TaxID=28454 RepID=A0ABX7CVM8_SPHMU|nr:6-bladed beta-propeller [Sphingobacterium multivorum]QQT55325.1 6-bladed beta-propeller [Sphingobacterium multivorum]